MAAISFPLPEGEIEQAREQSAPWVSRKLGRSGEGVSKKGEGVGAYPTPSPSSLLFAFTCSFVPTARFLEKAAMQAKEIYLSSTQSDQVDS